MNRSTTVGTYYVRARAYAQDTSSDSLNAGLHGQELASAQTLAGLGTLQWAWTHGSGSRYIDIPTPGIYTVNVWGREDGVRFDKIALSTNPSEPLSGVGPAESLKTSSGPPVAPVPLSVTPSSGSGASQTFTAVYSDANGAADINYAYWLLRATVDYPGSCAVRYYAPNHAVYLINDAGSSWGGGVAPGGSATLSNSTCELDVSGVSVTRNGTTLTMTLPIEFTTQIEADRNAYLYSSDSSSLNSGWTELGTWTTPGGTVNSGPVFEEFLPASGQGASQVFTFRASDANGASDIVQLKWLWNSTVSWDGACGFIYNRLSNELHFRQNATQYFSPASPGDALVLDNGVCSLDFAGITVSEFDDDVLMSFPITFDASVSGERTSWIQAIDMSGYSTNWAFAGTWTGTGTGSTPVPISVTPSTGSGTAGQFTYVISDIDGADDIPRVTILINDMIDQQDSCFVGIDAASEEFDLRADDDTAWLGSIDFGSSATIENSQCAISGATSSITQSGTDLIIVLDVAFKPAYAGPANHYVYAEDWLPSSVGTTIVGTWNIEDPSNQAPSVVSATPSSGSGSQVDMTFRFSDPNNYADIYAVSMIIDPQPDSFDSCYVYVKRPTAEIWLSTDAGGGTNWFGPVTLGSASTLENSQCLIDVSSSSLSGSGDNLDVTLDLTFKSGLTGSNVIWGSAYDGLVDSGGVVLGSWTAP